MRMKRFLSMFVAGATQSGSLRRGRIHVYGCFGFRLCGRLCRIRFGR